MVVSAVYIHIYTCPNSVIIIFLSSPALYTACVYTIFVHTCVCAHARTCVYVQRCYKFQAFPGLNLKCTVTGVHEFVSGHEKSGDTNIAVKLIGEGLQSKNILVGVASNVQQCQVVPGNRRWLELNGFNAAN